jgi:hypothetical protein
MAAEGAAAASEVVQGLNASSNVSIKAVCVWVFAAAAAAAAETE